ncbi:exo-beta-1,3-glucanase Exg0 [Lineolata rhizophorae]|uniref:Exo-beta-1,3-glucanase Exg0 n=1 Tax=Lineolata rhizophorae TaxID=578093 RepID=A0A6A6PD67_9PEZI|nr:exo-beta-1,3-glucanase Exg0 [Lineolata rhizophorae]
MIAFNAALFAALTFFTLLANPGTLVTGVPLSTSVSVPDPEVSVAASADAGSFWMADIERNGSPPFNGNGDYKIFRNVKDYGAGNGGDDTDAINQAISEGNRCGQNCDSSTTTPAIVYFPPGEYRVSKPIVQYYYTQLIGDANDLPVIKADASFEGMAVIDADPYENDGSNWYTNQNNFFRQIRNFVIDLTEMPMDRGAGIHWQVAQATSLQNIRFDMIEDGSENNKQQGIFMDNGSGGFMADLTFNGGNYGAFFGSQQFTTRNLTFNNCKTAIFMNWNWLWTLKSLNINHCGIGIDMSNSPENQTVGSVLLMDSTFTNTHIGVRTAFKRDPVTVPETGGSLLINNVDFGGAPIAVASDTDQAILGNSGVVKSWAQGRMYIGSNGERVQDMIEVPDVPQPLIGDNGVFERTKPQYEDLSASSFVHIKDQGAVGDGSTDDTAAIQSAIDSVADDQILYFDHGAYLITDTITINKNIKIVGEIWPMLLATGDGFADETSLKPMIKVGEDSTALAVEMQDLILGTQGPAPGCTLMQWNAASEQGQGALWDVHFRVGGYAGTNLQSDQCSKNPDVDHSDPNMNCVGAGLLLHTTGEASAYIENCWFWVSDHELDMADHNQIDIFNARGVLLESTGAVWLWGTASEHNVLYNYQLNGAQNVFMGHIQTETPYYQSNPDATKPFAPQQALADPDFSSFCSASGNDSASCKKSWGVRVMDSSDVLIYGAGLYSFFENYGQVCVGEQNCQTNMVSIEGDSDVSIFGLSTKAAVNMVTRDGESQALDADNRSNFCATLALWRAS